MWAQGLLYMAQDMQKVDMWSTTRMLRQLKLTEGVNWCRCFLPQSWRFGMDLERSMRPSI